MRNLEITRTRGAAQALLLAVALAIPASTLALPMNESDFDVGEGRRADAPPVSSVWERPAAGEPAVIVRPPEAPPPAPERTISANPLWEIPLTSLSGTRERPIFSPSRRPPPPPAVVATPVAKDPPPAPMPPRVERPQLSLVGTIAGDEQSFGIFVDQTTEAALRLKLGEDYQGWKLRSVQGREVTLERDQHTTILSLPQPGTTTTDRLRLRTETAATPGAVEPVHHRDSRR
jgi:general secretion pathway protein N